MPLLTFISVPQPPVPVFADCPAPSPPPRARFTPHMHPSKFPESRKVVSLALHSLPSIRRIVGIQEMFAE